MASKNETKIARNLTGKQIVMEVKPGVFRVGNVAWHMNLATRWDGRREVVKVTFSGGEPMFLQDGGIDEAIDHGYVS